jgi:hypothetical protein
MCWEAPGKCWEATGMCSSVGESGKYSGVGILDTMMQPEVA